MTLSRSPGIRSAARETARILRREQTHAEQVLWEALRNRRLVGRKFLRQHSILVEYQDKETFFIADFYCAAEGLIVEVDRQIHRRRLDLDDAQDRTLSELGYRVLRFSNDEVEKNLPEVLRGLCEAFRHSPPHSPSLSHEREGDGG